MIRKLYFSLLLLGTYTYSYASAPNLYVPFGDEIATKSSDHIMVASDIDFNGKKITCTTWNSWARGTQNGFMGDPGYSGSTEPNVNGRMQMNAGRIQQQFMAKPTQIMAFQEWNPNDLWTLQTTLGSQYYVLNTPTAGESFHHGIIFDSRQFNLVTQSSTSLPDLNALSTNVGVMQTQRYLHTILQDNATHQWLNIVSLHLKWQSNPGDIQKILTNIFNQPSHWVVMGDFNVDLSSLALSNGRILPSINGSQSFNRAAQHPQLKTTDAITYKLTYTPSNSQMSVPMAPQTVSVIDPAREEFNRLLGKTNVGVMPFVALAYQDGVIDLQRLVQFTVFENTDQTLDLLEAFIEKTHPHFIFSCLLAKVEPGLMPYVHQVYFAKQIDLESLVQFTKFEEGEQTQDLLNAFVYAYQNRQ